MKHTLTRLLALVLCLCLAIPFAGCGNQEEPATQPATSDVSTDPADTSDTGTETDPTDATESTDPTESTAPSESAAGTDTIQPTRTTATTAAPSTGSSTQASTTPAPTTTTTTASAVSTTAVTTTKASTTTTTTQGKKPIVTFTTTTQWTTTTKDKSQGKAIKILAIGNSFSVDAMHNHLFDIFASAGYTDITLGHLYISGCNLDTHYDSLKSNSPAYTFYRNTDGVWEKTDGVAAGTGFGAARWDVVTIQQVSTESGRPQTYAHLQDILDIVKQKEPQAKIFWHMTWAYQQDSTHWAFAYYEKDQTTMYRAITDTVQAQVLPLADVAGVIPSGTAIQNLRTSGLGDTLTSDGHHLRDTYGDYTAALTWFCTLTGEDPEAVGYCPTSVSDQWDAISRSVKNALKTPYAVTDCT